MNWCPGLGTVLANEEVTDEGRSERGNYPVFPRKMRQWMLRITAYADRLIDDLDLLDWPESIKAQQRNWIGRSERADAPAVLGQPPVVASGPIGCATGCSAGSATGASRFPSSTTSTGPVALPESMLPVELPETADFTPTDV